MGSSKAGTVRFDTDRRGGDFPWRRHTHPSPNSSCFSVGWDEACYYPDEDQRHRRGHADHVAWLDEKFGLPPAHDPDIVVATARAELGERFASWASGFLPSRAAGWLRCVATQSM